VYSEILATQIFAPVVSTGTDVATLPPSVDPALTCATNLIAACACEQTANMAIIASPIRASLDSAADQRMNVRCSNCEHPVCIYCFLLKPHG
jgi:hypothetical protein